MKALALGSMREISEISRHFATVEKQDVLRDGEPSRDAIKAHQHPGGALRYVFEASFRVSKRAELPPRSLL